MRIVVELAIVNLVMAEFWVICRDCKSLKQIKAILELQPTCKGIGKVGKILRGWL